MNLMAKNVQMAISLFNGHNYRARLLFNWNLNVASVRLKLNEIKWKNNIRKVFSAIFVIERITLHEGWRDS